MKQLKKRCDIIVLVMTERYFFITGRAWGESKKSRNPRGGLCASISMHTSRGTCKTTMAAVVKKHCCMHNAGIVRMFFAKDTCRPSPPWHSSGRSFARKRYVPLCHKQQLQLDERRFLEKNRENWMVQPHGMFSGHHVHGVWDDE